MAEVSEITFSGFKLRLTHEGGTYTAGRLPNSYPPDPNAPVTQLGSPFSLETPSQEALAAKVGEAMSEGEVQNAKMLGIRLVGKFVKEHPEVVAS